MQKRSSIFSSRIPAHVIGRVFTPLALACAATAMAARAGWQTYDSTAAKLRPDLKSHFVGFSFSYPETFKVKEQQDGIFVVVAKFAPNGTDEQESFTVSWFEADDAKSNDGSAIVLDGLSAAWADKMSGYRTRRVSSSSRKIDGVMADGATWEFTTRDSPPVFAGGARSYVLHQPGTTKGVRIDQYGTYLDPKLKSIKDLGQNDDLARILATFTFHSDPESASETTPKTAPAEPDKLSPEEQGALVTAALKWLVLLDAGNYGETYQSAAEPFRQKVPVVAWKRNHALMQKQFGEISRRSENASITGTRTTSEDGKQTMTYMLKIKSTFSKTTAVENLTMTKEGEVWKVADYSIETKSE